MSDDSISWKVESETNECLNCGGHVLPQTVKVFGNNAGKLFKCPNCATFRDLNSKGSGSDE